MSKKKQFSKKHRQKLSLALKGRILSEEWKKKISKTKKGKKAWNKDVPQSIEWKLKNSLAHKGKKLSKEHKENIKKSLKGRLFNWGDKISKSLSGKKLSNSHKESIRKSLIGRKQTEEHIRNVRKALKDIVFSKERNEKISIAMKGKKFSEEHRRKIGEANKKRRCSEETRRKMSDAHIGEKGANWLGGISFEPYGIEFNSKLKEKIRKRDNYHCQECFRHQDELYTKNGKRYKLMIHHIDYDKKNNQENNLISLCRSCHMQTNFNREDWSNYYKNKTINT